MLTGLMHALSFVGSAGFYLPLLVVVFWCVSPRAGARLGVVLVLGAALNTVLKLAFHAPRPYWTDPSVTGREPIESFGMPSGHAQNAAVVWGFAATLTRRRVLWAGAAALVVLIGASRVYLGVHSAGQVLAGWAIGAVVLVAAVALEPVVVPAWRRAPLAAQLAMALAIALAFLGGAWAAVDALSGWTWPASWARAVTLAGGTPQPVTLGDAAGASGGLFGIIAGVSVLARRGWFRPSDVLWRRLACLPVGALGAFALYTAGLFLGTRPVQAFTVQALLALWTAAGAPEAFVRLRLARRTTRALTRPGEERVELRQ
ncbi:MULTISPECIES: phosphatase PAP2 family protein [Actinomadura]|uniref:Phosphatase PAP2 family protein n=1 Tax=Actinomadura yumaensis TaxID=111807 RepID=A0ABW2CNZ5_9ACTN|nr:phosphatase PAP2 family protein [Actinomadura sp. J1-007]MWK32844.1 phosphatase PAP2 family protein [Actinomadura sp. J1-007]